MDFNSIMIKNIKYNIKSYISFLLGNSLILCILFMFLKVYFSPDFLNAEATLNVKSNFNSIVVLMCGFSIIFIIFSITSFIKYRGKEIGVYFTIGLTLKEIIKILSFENIIISLITFVSSSILGSLFSKLFQMAIGKILGINVIDMPVNAEPFLVIVIITISIFIITIIYSMFYLKRYSVVSILKSNKNKNIGSTNKIIGVIGIILFIASLIIFKRAVNGDFSNYTKLFTISILGTVISLYLIIGYSMTLIVSFVRKFKRLYNNNILFINSLSHRFSYFRSVLYVVILMISGAMFFISISYSSYKDIEMHTNRTFPNDASLILTQENFNEDKIKNLISNSCPKSQVKVVESINIPQIEVIDGEYRAYKNIPVISEDSYKSLGCGELNLNKDEVLYLHKGKKNFLEDSDIILPLSTEMCIKVMDLDEFKEKNSKDSYVYVSKEYIHDKEGLIFNSFYSRDFSRMEGLVINNEDYDKLKENSEGKKITYDILINSKEGENYSSLREEIKSKVDEKTYDTLTIKDEMLDRAIKEGSFELFIYSFLGMMFLIGSGAVLYFKTMTSLNEDKERSVQLIKIGLTEKEVLKLLMKELKCIFLIPPVLAVFIIGYFLSTLYNCFSNGEYMWQNTLVVLCIYGIIQILFYMLISNKYKRLLK